ncbi:MAG: hypothetical protein ACO3SO_07980, partial [Luteolibacter sp.]
MGLDTGSRPRLLHAIQREAPAQQERRRCRVSAIAPRAMSMVELGFVSREDGGAGDEGGQQG